MEGKLFDSELKVMEVLWEQGPRPAKEIVDILSARIGWNKNTTYTVIRKCIEKIGRASCRERVFGLV